MHSPRWGSLISKKKGAPDGQVTEAREHAERSGSVAGYYQINASVQFTGSTTNPLCYITKNGSQVKCGSYTTGSFTGPVSVASGLVYLNGSTDYVEVAAYHATGSSVNTLAAADTTRFDGCLVRPA